MLYTGYIYTEKYNIEYLFRFSKRTMLIFFSGFRTKKILNTIYFHIEFSQFKKCYVIKSLNLLIINNVKEIVIINTKRFQIQTVINKEVPDKNIAIVEDKILVICGKNAVQLFCLKSYKNIFKMFVNNLNNIVQIQEKRFIFAFNDTKQDKITYFYL